MKPVEIAGGGLAGLSLGISLRKRGVPITIMESGSYPRHKVCGEFICGVERATLQSLGIVELFDRSPSYSRSAWFRGDAEISRNDLPNPAWGISRYEMDDWLQQEFRKLGGKLITRQRAKPAPREGFVWCAGRKPQPSKWIGLKTHIRGYELAEPLEMHMGRGGYAGLVEVEDGWVNICGLFKKRRDISARKEALLPAYLGACGLHDLAEKTRTCEWREGAFSAVAGFQLGHQQKGSELIVVGDAESMIPPFTGNGMSMAFEAAETATHPLVEWSQGDIAWHDARSSVARLLQKRFAMRLSVAQSAHSLLLGAAGQSLISAAASSGLLPFRCLFRLTR